MAIKKGYSRQTIYNNIATLRAEGKPRPQSIAIALHEARKSYHKRYPQGALPKYLTPPSGQRLKKNPSPRFHEMERAAAELYEEFSGHPGEIVGTVDKPEMPDVAVVVGELEGIAYETVRDGIKEKYFHKFSKKARPLLCVSFDGQQLLIVGGEYEFTDHGIVDKA
jgi:hypothetical protein